MSRKSAASDEIMSPWSGGAVTEELLRETLTGHGWMAGWLDEGMEHRGGRGWYLKWGGSRRPAKG